jgi:hypothetical protein
MQTLLLPRLLVTTMMRQVCTANVECDCGDVRVELVQSFEAAAKTE